MKITDLKLNLEQVDNGIWVSDIPELEGVSFLVRGTESQAYQRAMRKALQGVGRKARMAAINDPTKYEDLTNRLIAEHLLLDWKGVDDDDGKAIPFDRALATTLMTSREYTPFRRAVLYAVERVDTNTAETKEEILGN